jgi:predicted AlkP superfamily pyrophosphatase or phosphodiesterase
MRQPVRLLISIVLLVVILFPSAVAQRRAANSGAAPRPRLVLLTVVDQFRYDYLKRFGDLYVAGGFKRLLRSGASWENANYDYLPTKTAPGHSAIMTGAPPAATGIVANEWLERSNGPMTTQGRARMVTSVTDDDARTLGGGSKESAYSPRRLLASTVGDELRLATNDRAKVIGVSDKARAAVLPPGRRANGAYWFSSYSGSMVSSNYYFPRLPAWVTEFNKTRPADKYFRATWQRLLPESEYLRRAGPDSPPWENIGDVKSDTNAFPHTITGGAEKPSWDFYEELDHSPFLNDMLISFTQAAIASEELGQDADTDVLCLSLSATDHVGHRFGPYSQEAMDMAVRVDRQIAGLLEFVDARVGLGNTLVILTADHGVSPIPEHAAALGLGGRRIGNAEVLTAIRSGISRHFNRENRSPDPTQDYILKYTDAGKTLDGMMNSNIYFNLAALERDGVNLEEISQVAGEAALTVPGIARYFTRGQLLSDCAVANERRAGETRSKIRRGAVTRNGRRAGATFWKFGELGGDVAPSESRRCAGQRDPVALMAQRGFYSSRSGDLVLLADPFKYLGDSADPANHGTPYTYDTHVPLIIMGPGFRPGHYLQAASPTDVARTLARLLDIRPPDKARGRVLHEALKTEVRSQKSEVRSQRSEVRSQKSEVRSQRSEIRSQKSVVCRTPDS